jgi:molybdopterin-guanine dinucleotide biosynthesis protein A
MQITGIILAGGKSTRMGTDKALIQIEGKTLIERIIEVCQPICSEILISSNNLEHEKSGFQIITDEIQNCGPIGGIFSCLKKSVTNWNFIVSVDTPFVTNDFVQFLAGQTENCDVVVPVHSGEKEPLIALYNRSCLREIQNQIEHREYKMHHLIAKLNTCYVDASEWIGKTPLLFKNLNRPDDL